MSAGEELIQIGTGPANLDLLPAPSWRPALPRWLKRPLPLAGGIGSTRDLIADLNLETICESGKCPNRTECWSRKTATFMVLGETCTRPCGFCAVKRGKPEEVAADEPDRLAEAAARMGRRHVVITSVTRDDLPDGGAAHVAATIAAIRAASPDTRVEVLISDLRGDPDALGVILAARPDVLNHNLETVARLQRAVRPSAGYARSLALLARSAAAGIVTKSGIMVGLGETLDEVRAAMHDLRGVRCDILTLGQYLQPTLKHLPVIEFVPPAVFESLRVEALALGFTHVASGPLVRSSYHADEFSPSRSS